MNRDLETSYGSVTDNMNLLFITNVYPNPIDPTKGIFNHSLVRALTRRHDVHVIAPISWPDELLAGRGRTLSRFGSGRSLTLDGIPVDYPRYYYSPKVLRRFYGLFYWWSMRHAVTRLRATWRPDAVIAFWAHPDGEAAVRAARLMGVPSAVIVGGSDVLLLTKDVSRRGCVRNVLSASDAVLTVSRNLRDKVVELGIPGEKVHVWARGIDTSFFSPGDRLDARRRLGIPVTRPSLVWVGRMVPSKGLDVLLESCAVLWDRGVDYHLCLVGDGPLRTQLMARTEVHRLSAHITFVGPKLHEELPELVSCRRPDRAAEPVRRTAERAARVAGLRHAVCGQRRRRDQRDRRSRCSFPGAITCRSYSTRLPCVLG